MSNRILIIDEMHESIVPMLQELGFIVDYSPHIQREDILEIISRYEGLILRSKTQIDQELIDRATNLLYVGRAGAGVDQIEVDYLQKKGIEIVNAPEGNRDALGEHMVGMLLNLFNNISRAHEQVKHKRWDREGNRGVELMNKAVSIIGYGNMGSAFAKRLSSFDCEVLAYDNNADCIDEQYAKKASLEEIFDKTDVLSLHIPLTPENKYFVNQDFVDRFKKPFYLLNSARGEIVAFQTLVDNLRSQKILGAALDVLESEKLHSLTTAQEAYFDYLAHHPHVLFTPHVAGWSFESYKKINEVLVKKILDLKSRLNFA